MGNLRTIQQLTAQLCLGLLLFSLPASAQTGKIDSLLNRLKSPLADTAKLSTLRKLSAAYTSVDPAKKSAVAKQYQLLAIRLHNGEALADSWSDLGVSCSIRGKYDSALYYYGKAYKQATKVNYLAGMGKSLTNTGYTYDRMDNNTESIRYYFQALAIFRKIHFDKGINQCNTNIGSIYFDLLQYKLALTYFQLVLDNYTKSQDQQGLGYALFTVGNCYNEMDQPKKALAYFTRSLAIREKLGDQSGIALVHRSLGILYKKTGQYDLALSHLKIALPIVQTLQDRYLEGAVIMVMAEAYYGKKDYPAAEKYALQSLALSKAIQSKLMSTEALAVLVNVNRDTHKLEKAFAYQTTYNELKDSIFNEQVLKNVSMVELSRVRSENAALAKDNAVIQTTNTDNLGRIQKYSRTIVITVLVLLVAILFALVFYFRNREKQATNILLQQQKEQIATINTELESLNEEITTQNEITTAQNLELERLNAVKNKFFSIISHDLRSPLSTLRSLFAIYRQGGLTEEEVGEFLARLEDTVLDTSTFLDNLLEWSKSQMDGIVVKPVVFNIRESIDENIRLLEAQATLKNIRIVSGDLSPVMVLADQNMIRLVIRNLLSNSIKFCDEGDEIIFSTREEGNRVVVSIRDTGPGIDNEDLNRLFSLEHTLTTGTKGEKGNGLGLILCRDMLLQNNGRIWFETDAGKGSTFLFELDKG